METYLEALERLGKLRDAGVLTKEEFEAEKAHLLHTRRAGEEIEEPRWKARPRYRLVLGALTVVLLGGGVSFLIFKDIGESSRAAQATEVPTVSSRTVAAPSEQDLSITFADASKCEPGASLSDFLTKVRDAASSDLESDLRLIRLAGSSNSVEVQSAVRNFGPQQIRLGRLPASQVWHGLHLTEVRTTDWDTGTGFQLRFTESPDSLLRVAQAAGLPIKTLEKPEADSGVFMAIEKLPNGASLTCMRSNKSSQDSAATDVSVNGWGE